jgi:hypothetical protein
MLIYFTHRLCEKLFHVDFQHIIKMAQCWY